MGYINLINLINLNLVNKSKYFYIKLDNKGLWLLNKFLDLNIVSLVKCLDKNKNLYKIHISYINHVSIYKSVKIYYKSSKPIFVNLKTLEKTKNYKNNNVYLILTNKGVLTNTEAMKLNRGGVLLCKCCY